MNETAKRLLDLAEARISKTGYWGFSFRDLAAEIGINKLGAPAALPSLPPSIQYSIRPPDR